MRITGFGKGNVGGGLADAWDRAGHPVTRLGRDGGNVSGFVFETPERLRESLVLIGNIERRRAELERRFPLLPDPRADAQIASCW